jgi:hypothetical protein
LKKGRGVLQNDGNGLEKIENAIKSPLALAVVLEGELELGDGIEELAGDFVEENGAFAVELGCHSCSLTS